MSTSQDLLCSPEYYPLQIDFERRTLTFVRMSRETYRDSVFLDFRTRHLGTQFILRLDDVLLAAAQNLRPPQPVTYILHPAFCCSTLLARYFESLSFMFVLKEPLLLTQLALTPRQGLPSWQELLELSVRLLTRTFDNTQRVLIKAHEPCNAIGLDLLQDNQEASVIFIATPLSHFVLSVLKSAERRNWVRRRVHEAVGMTGFEEECPSHLSDAEAAACLWSINYSLREQLSTGPSASRVFRLDSERLIDAPGQTLFEVSRFCRLPADEGDIATMLSQPSARKYSKDLSRTYDSASRKLEIAQLEHQFRRELESATNWANLHPVSLGVAS